MNRTATVFLFLTAAIVFTVRVTARSDIYDQDQPKTISYTADIVLNGRWVLPRDDSGMSATKPPLINWIGALAVMATGRWDEWILKLPSLLAGAATLALTVLLARAMLAHLRDEGDVERDGSSLRSNTAAVACLAGIIWLTPFPTSKLIFLARPDMMLIACLSAAWYCATRAMEPSERKPTAWAAGFWLAVIAAALTKGPPAVLPIVYAPLAARLIHKRWGAAARLGWWWGLPLALAFVGLWLWGAYTTDPAHFMNRLVGREVVQRVGRKGTLGPLLTFYRQPIYFIRYFLPWSIVVIVFLARLKPRMWMKHAAAPAILWLFACLVFFSLAPGGRADYIAPAYVAGSILAAIGLVEMMPRAKFPALAAIGLAVALMTACYVWFASAAARSRDGETIHAFVRDVRPRIGSDAVYFRGSLTYPIQTLLGRHQLGDGNVPPPNTVWIIGPVRGGAAADVRTEPMDDTRGGYVVVGLTRYSAEAQSTSATSPVTQPDSEDE